MCNCDELIKAIDVYIEKADNNLEQALEQAGFANPRETVQQISRLERLITDVLLAQTAYFLDKLRESVDLEAFFKEVFPLLQERDPTGQLLARLFFDTFSEGMKPLVSAYVAKIDEEMTVQTIFKRTINWVKSWSQNLARIMKLNSHKEIEDILTRGLDQGKSVVEVTEMISNSGIRNEYYKARRVAQTEMLRAHSVAAQEAMTQSPAVEAKEWRHTGSRHNTPRQNHVAMDHQRVPKDEPFTLIGRDGRTYKPMYPRDTSLPPSESINCHCISQPIVSADVLGLPIEERRKLQAKALDEANAKWEKEETKQVDAIRSKSRAEQIEYFGGGDEGKQRLALLDSGVVSTDKELSRLYKTTNDGSVVRKTLQELTDDGIMTVSRATLDHCVHGDYIAPSRDYPHGRLRNGGHGSINIEELTQRGIEYHVTHTFQNGVRAGYVVGHKEKAKNGITETMVNNNGRPGTRNADKGQTWFPPDWTEDDIRAAGTYVANKPESENGLFKAGTFRGVRIGIYTDAINNNGMPTTIFPDNSKQPTADGWEVLIDNG